MKRGIRNLDPENLEDFRNKIVALEEKYSVPDAPAMPTVRPTKDMSKKAAHASATHAEDESDTDCPNESADEIPDLETDEDFDEWRFWWVTWGI